MFPVAGHRSSRRNWDLTTMCQAHPEISATSNSARENDPVRHRPSELTAQSLFKITSLSLITILVGLVSAVLGNVAYAAYRTTILNFICSTYESARQVAVERSWERSKSMPSDCITLYQRRFELRVAEILQVIEVISIGNGRWIEIGRVRSAMGLGYSAGIAEDLFLY